MVSFETTEFLIDYLYQKISASINPDFGCEDNNPKKSKEAELCDFFERYIYSANNRYFLLSKSGVLWVYNGRHYEMVETTTFLKELVKKTMQRLKVSRVYEKFSSKFIANECLSGMENCPEGRFNPNRRYIAFNNGIFDVKEGVLKEFSIDYCTDLILDIDYDQTATFDLWDEKLNEIIPNEQMREALQMFCGVLLIDRSEIKVEYMCYIIGPGSNGKSVIASSIAAVFGDRYFSKFSPRQLLKDSNSMFNMASLDGKIANFTDDLDSENFSGGAYKKLVSGEKFPARHPFGRNVFDVSAPMMLCCANNMPNTTDDSIGHHRRNLVINSTRVVRGEKNKDPRLQKKLASKEARTAIFNWIYEGYKKIIANDGNIDLGADVIEAQNEARDDSSSLRRWIRDNGYVRIDERPDGDASWKSLKDWYVEYKNYCFDMGDKNPQTAKSMSRVFKEKDFAYKHKRDGAWYCIGQADENGNIIGEQKEGHYGNGDDALPF